MEEKVIMLTVLASILIALGTCVVVSLVVYVAAITIVWFKNKLRERLSRNHGITDTVVIDSDAIKGEIAKAISGSKKKNMTMDELDSIFGDDGIVMADIDESGNVDVDSIEIFSTDEMDDKVKKVLSQGPIQVSA